MKDLIAKLSSNLIKIGEPSGLSHINALFKFADDPEHNPTQGQVVKSFTFKDHEDLKFESGVDVIAPEVKAYIKDKVLENLKAWSEDSRINNWQIDIKIQGNASHVPIKGGNVALADRRAESMRKEIAAILAPTNLLESTKVRSIDVAPGEVSGERWKVGENKHDQKYKDHQFVNVILIATGKEVPPDRPQKKTKIRVFCINLAGQQIEVKCVISGEETKCSVEPAYSSNADFGWHEDGPCPEDETGRIYEFPISWKRKFFVCQDKYTGMLLKDKGTGLPLVGVEDVIFNVGLFCVDPNESDTCQWKNWGNIISKSKLESLCKDFGKLLLVIEWPKKEKPPTTGTGDSPYCIEDTSEYKEVAKMLPLRSDGASNPGVVDIVYEFLMKGWSEPVMVSFRSGGSEVEEGIYGEPGADRKDGFFQFKSQKESRRLAQKAWKENSTLANSQSLKEKNEDSIKDAIQKWITSNNLLDGPIKNIYPNKYFNYNNPRLVSSECSGWDYIRWGGPCETWAAGAALKSDTGFGNAGDWSGPNQGGENSYLPIKNENSKHIRVLKWFIGHSDMVDELRELKKREQQAGVDSQRNDPRRGVPGIPGGGQQLGDTATDPDAPNPYNQDEFISNQIKDSMLKSRGFRRNILRRIKNGNIK
jgi:hypothetical protein